MKKILDLLKTQVKDPIQAAKINWHTNDINLENDIEDLKVILEYIKNKTIRFQNDNCNDKTTRNQPSTCEGTERDVPKRKGRQAKTSTVSSESKFRSITSDSLSLNDTAASTSSTRSRRAAAQAAEHKLSQVQSLVQLKTKLRRPTNFDEKQSKVISSPPAKCRRTHKNQSAGSSSSLADEVNARIDGERNKNVVVAYNEDLSNKMLNNGCSVSVEKLTKSTIKSFTHPNSRSSRSLDRAPHRNSKDLFNDSDPLSKSNSKPLTQEAPTLDSIQKTTRKKSLLKKDLDSGISSTEEELQQLMKTDLPIAQSSPILEPCDGDFRGFDDEPQNNRAKEQAALGENTFIVGIKTEKNQVLSKKITSQSEESDSEEIGITETNIVKSKTKVLRKRGAEKAVNVEEKENMNGNNDTYSVTNKLDESPNLRSRTKVLKRTIDHVKNTENDENSSEEDLKHQISPETRARSRTKTIKKHNEQHVQVKSDDEIVVKGNRSRTKTIRKNNEKEIQSDSINNESSNMGSRTKTITSATNNKATTNGLDSEYLISEFKNNPTSMKVNNVLLPVSPAPAKGELVKKRVEDFEKMQNGMEEVEEDKAIGRVTRNAMKSKMISSATEPSSKQARTMMQLPASHKKTVRKSLDKVKRHKIKEEKENIPTAKLQASANKQLLSSDRPRTTPLGVNNRMTPVTDPSLKAQINKWANSASHPTPVETNKIVLINKQATEEAERKKKEEERLKRQAKEEDAKRKKENALKATAEEARRKRAEKAQRVAATREAAEKEKERLAAKAEKEKEEKLRQIAIEKEKQKEEQLKKKQLMQQKTVEHEERRKQEEAARLAKLKEQEEEHKRLLAMKEREQELQKQQKTELRHAEIDKNKLGGKLGKIAAINNAKLKMQQGMTPSDKTKATQPTNCYEITPAREDRPLLQPKTENDYGIDDAHSGDSSDDESQPRKMIPTWAQPKNRDRLLMVNKYIPNKLWNMFMECDPCPDINEMFAGNAIKRRIRTSSAVWRTPPKYSRVAPK